MAKRGHRIPDAIYDLPHWARVAFAARCARRSIEVFRESWRNAPPERLEALEVATQLAEQSAAKGQPQEGLDEAILNAVKAAGAALMEVYGVSGLYEVPREELAPSNESEATNASCAAKVAEKAAEAARASRADSTLQALEAYTFARDAAHSGEAADVLEGLQADFDGLYRVAKRGKWTDETVVPPSVFDLVSDESTKPWWKFW